MITRLLGLLAVVGLAVVLVAPASAVSSPTFAIVVDCDDVDGSSTAEPLGVTMPTGWYAVEVTGACFLAYPALDRCHLVGYAYTTGCGAPTTVGACAAGYVAVDGQCPTQGGAGLVHHSNQGPITARVIDSHYPDNEGYFVVTVTWTPL